MIIYDELDIFAGQLNCKKFSEYGVGVFESGKKRFRL